MALPSPLVAGDWPDPSLITDNGETVAVSTADGWTPSLRILRSADLVNWRLTGSVFRRNPGWVQTNFWAPEVTRLQNGYAVFYSARARRRVSNWYCLGVATAPTLDGPWRDAGRPLRCGRRGSIDPEPVRDENGRLHLLWKEDGNEFRRKTPIFAQPLREDGKRLLGRPTRLMTNDARWERRVVEAPEVFRAGGYFQMIYSGNLCCTKRCAYAVGVARSTTLLGPWQKYSGNPILRSGRGWRCPGHVSVLPDAEGGLTAFFHAYRAGEERVAGRQILAAPVTVGADGWPRIGDGLPPPPAPGARSLDFTDDFSGRKLAGEWEWPTERTPRTRTGNGLRLRASPKSKARHDGGVIARRTARARYTGRVVLDRGGLRGESQGGIASYRSPFEAIGLSAGRGRAVIWQRRYGKFRLLASARVPAARLLHLRVIARGNNFRFSISRDGTTWRTVGRTFHGPIEESARFALTAGGVRGASARFISASLAER